MCLHVIKPQYQAAFYCSFIHMGELHGNPYKCDVKTESETDGGMMSAHQATLWPFVL